MPALCRQESRNGLPDDLACRDAALGRMSPQSARKALRHLECDRNRVLGGRRRSGKELQLKIRRLARPMIRIFVTGGTFDKQYKELTGALAFSKTHLPEMLRLGRSRVDVAIETLMMIDSLDMTAADRARIVERCRQAGESRIGILRRAVLLRVAAAAVAVRGAMVRVRRRAMRAVGTPVGAGAGVPVAVMTVFVLPSSLVVR